MRDRLSRWVKSGSQRIDGDRDGHYDHPQAPAIMDAWWPRLVHAVFDAASGQAITNLGLPIHGPPQTHAGSSFASGLYGHVVKDLRRLLGEPVRDPWPRVYCGAGDAAACAGALWGSLARAATDLESEFGSPRVEDWRRRDADDEIRFASLSVVSVEPIHWVNRPTFQQVVQVGESRLVTDKD